MEKIITDLWYGNIRPWEQSNCGDQEFLALTSRVCEDQHALLDNLTPAQRELYEKYNQTCIELEGVIAKNAFTSGFCLGTRLILGVMGTQTGE